MIPAARALLVLLMIALVVAFKPLNDGFYSFWIYDDPQTPEQLREAGMTTWAFRYTSGVLCGQFLSFASGLFLGGRRRWSAPALAAVLALVTVAVAIPLARSSAFAPPPVPAKLLVVELLAYPLWAIVGLGVAAWLAGRRDRGGVIALMVLVWWLSGLAGLLFSGTPTWLLPLFPPLAAGAAITRTGVAPGWPADAALLALLTGLILCALLAWRAARAGNGARPVRA
ncbi:hypothetical protein CLV70_11745 [Pseudosporangium ferrugineum]|uniref:Uncharacterized protein n=2 Tax=Pseudosporangium ferrugineum TaxID=439699 RepID=A0A2T0RMJ3_9ACTN|nr:hypothetical protein CLV70_11745 [Pseudosporangium ferrugineum]